MLVSSGRYQRLNIFFIKNGQANGISLEIGEPAQRGCQIGGILYFCVSCVPVIHRGAGIDHNPDSNACFYFRFPDIIAVGPCIHFPVKLSEVIARLVASVLTEFETLAFDGTFVNSAHKSINRRFRGELQVFNRNQYLGIR